jgi:hypothetical protein
MRPLDLSGQVIPLRLLPAEVALWQLEQQHRWRLGDAPQVIQRDQPVPVSGWPASQPMQPLVGLPFVLLEVAHRMEDHGAALTCISVHPKHRLLGHHPRRQERGRGLSQQPADLGFEVGNHAALPVGVQRGLGWDRRQHRGSGCAAVPLHEPAAPVPQRGELRLFGHLPFPP